MNYYIQQTIQIQSLRVNYITNSSIFQIGSSGIIKGSSHLYNSGGFTEPPPRPEKPFANLSPLVPLTPPRE